MAYTLLARTQEDMNAARHERLDTEVAWKNWDYSLPARQEAERQRNAVPGLKAVRQRPLRTRSLYHVKPLTTASHLSRSWSAAASTQGYERLPEDADIIKHRSVEDLRDPQAQWDKAEETLISAFFLVWAVGVVALSCWHMVNQLSANTAHLQVAVAVVAATCSPVVFFINRQD
ncbi:hypothetical protein T484DRAFT_3629712 [Baffinella frigidus]|nr:hypothetical protein T484DRAFT_3629712 [Cryptophyta sp. CCMP2293]